jgi:plasmid stability protein
MRTTIRLDDGLLRRAKARAAASGRSLNDFIADAVRAALAVGRQPGRVVELPTFPGGVLLPGVDLDDTASLLELMESASPSSSDAAGRRAASRVAEEKVSRKSRR